MGGTGFPPDGARENWGKNTFKDTLRIKEDTGADRAEDRRKRTPEKSISGGLPSPSSLKPPQSTDEAMKMVELGEKLVTLGLEGAASSLSSAERHALKAVFATIMVTIKVRLPYKFINVILVFSSQEKRGIKSASPASNGHASKEAENGDRGRPQMAPRNSRSPSPVPVKRERRSRSRSRRRGEEGWGREERGWQGSQGRRDRGGY